MNRVLCWLPAIISMLACSAPSPTETEVEGSIDLAIETNGVTINTVTYTITGGNYSRTSVLNVARSTHISALVGGLPAGSYQLSLSATDANDPSVRCSGGTTFDILARQTTTAGANLYCWRDATAGSVAINGYVHRCPTVDSFSAAPSEVLVGEVIHLSAVVENADPRWVYEWSATTGTLTGANTLQAELTCTSAGPVELQLLALNLEGMCADTASAQAYCSPSDAPAEVPDEPSPSE